MTSNVRHVPIPITGMRRPVLLRTPCSSRQSNPPAQCSCGATERAHAREHLAPIKVDDALLVVLAAVNEHVSRHRQRSHMSRQGRAGGLDLYRMSAHLHEK